jgi:mono/diheme cytochrome c family protein
LGRSVVNVAMRIATIACFALLLLANTVVASSASKQTSDAAQTVFKQRCSKCHGEDGRGDTDTGKSLKVKNLRSVAVQKLSNKQLASVIKEGKSNMPPFKYVMSDDEINSLVAYVLSLRSSRSSR